MEVKERYEAEIEKLSFYDEYTPPHKLLFTMEITDKCTLKCDHCFASASPDNNTFLDSDLVEKRADDLVELFQQYQPRNNESVAIEYFLFQAKKEGNMEKYNRLLEEMDELNLKAPTSASQIRITGGDAFLHNNLYDIINTFSSRKDLMNFSSIDVETNGWWAVDDETAKDIILKTKKAGADCISMTIDVWHKKNSPFPNDEYGKRIQKLAEKLDFPFRYITSGLSAVWGDWLDIKPTASPVGRARNLPESQWEGDFLKHYGCRTSYPNSLHPMGYSKTDEITIGPQGNVYLCNSGREFEDANLSLGRWYEKPILQLMEEDSNPILRLLKEKGVRGLTELLGISLEKHYELYDKMSPCGLCHEMLRENGKEIMEKLN